MNCAAEHWGVGAGSTAGCRLRVWLDRGELELL